MSRRAGLVFLATMAVVGIAVLWVLLPAEPSLRSDSPTEPNQPVASPATRIEPRLASSTERRPALIPAHADTSRIDAASPKAKREVARIQGLVVDTHGDPLPRCRVWAHDSVEVAGAVGSGQTDGDTGNGDTPEGIKADTDVNGHFVLEGLIAPSYRLLAMDVDSLASTETGPVRSGASNVQIQIDTDACYPCVAGQVVDYTGQPVPNMRVVVTRNSPDGGAMCGEVRTDEAGFFRLERVSRDAEGIGVLPERAVPRPFPISGVSNLCSLHLKIPSSGDVRVLVETPGLAADEFAVLDAQNRRIRMATHWQSGWMGPNETLPVGQEAIVSEDAATLVLLMKGQEVRRVPVRISPGEKQVVRL